MIKQAALLILVFSTPAFAQYFEPVAAEQWAAQFVTVDNPNYCDGLYDHEFDGTFAWDEFSVSFDHAFRCLDSRAAARGGLSSSVTGTRIISRMSWVGDISAESTTPNGWNAVRANAWYFLHFRIPVPLRVRIQGTAFLDFDAEVEPGHEEGATVELVFSSEGVVRVLHMYRPGGGQGDRRFDEELTLPAGNAFIRMSIFEAHLQQNASIHTGAEHCEVRATFQLDVIPCPGDIDADNVVSISDLVTLLPNMGLPGERAEGDLNGDQVVDLNDLTEMLSRFGSSCEW